MLGERRADASRRQAQRGGVSSATPPAVLDLDEVRSALRARAVLEFYGWAVKKSGDELESSACPQRSDHSRRAFVINANSGRWQCFPCGTAGDLFDFIAAAERLSMPSEFGAALTKAAEIAGVGPSLLTPLQRHVRREEWKERQRVAETKERENRRNRDIAAVPLATAYWDALLPEHSRGVEYLRERNVEDMLSLCADAVRFDPKHSGSPALALFSRDAEIRNVVARRVPELGEPKTPGLRDCPTAGTLINAVCQIERDRDVILTEGVIDSMTARCAWPSAIVLGAHGAGNLPKIARIAAPLIASAKTRMIVVPHQDRRGFETAVGACEFAVEAGLQTRKGSLQIVRHGQKDLNDAWRLGWRPAA
jgi:hypothetical protein